MMDERIFEVREDFAAARVRRSFRRRSTGS